MTDERTAGQMLGDFVRRDGLSVLDDFARLTALSMDLPLPAPVRHAIPQVAKIGVAKSIADFEGASLSSLDWSRFVRISSRELGLSPPILVAALEIWCRAFGVQPPAESLPAAAPPPASPPSDEPLNVGASPHNPYKAAPSPTPSPFVSTVPPPTPTSGAAPPPTQPSPPAVPIPSAVVPSAVIASVATSPVAVPPVATPAVANPSAAIPASPTPRPNRFSRPPGVYASAFRDGRRLVKQNRGLWTAATVVLTLFAGALFAPLVAVLLYINDRYLPGYRVSEANDTYVQIAAGLAIPCSALFLQLFFGMSRTATQAARGNKVAFRDLFCGFRRFAVTFPVCLLYTVLGQFGLYAWIGSGIFLSGSSPDQPENFLAGAFVLPLVLLLSGAFLMAPMVAIDQPVSIGQAFALGVRGAKRRVWRIAGILLLIAVYQLLAPLTFGLALFLTVPLACAVVGLHYHYLFPPPGAASPAP